MEKFSLIRPPERRITAALFDVDNVLVKSEHLHAMEGVIFFRKYGLELTEKDHEHYYMTENGGGTAAILDGYFSGRYGLSRMFVNMMRDRIFVDELMQDAEPVEGAVDLLCHMSKKRIPMAYATSNYRMSTQLMLESLGMSSMLPVGVDHEYILEKGLKKKPFGDPWIQAAQLLSSYHGKDIRPEDCLGIEDTTKGAISMARGGVGYRIVLLPDLGDMDKFYGEARPDLFVETLDTLMELNQELNLF